MLETRCEVLGGTESTVRLCHDGLRAVLVDLKKIAAYAGIERISKGKFLETLAGFALAALILCTDVDVQLHSAQMNSPWIERSLRLLSLVSP